jgi:N-acetylmuramoyl-L-alanine amidase
MSNYHAFRKISSGTQAIIIEIGFMNLDREILTIESDSVVKGLTNGILCFLKANH